MKLFLKADRCFTEKCAIEKRNYAPGQHGKGGRIKSKVQGYGLQLREKQKVKRLYGMLEGQFALTFDRASHEKGVSGELLLSSSSGACRTSSTGSASAARRPRAASWCATGTCS
jgi:small subunit ribosomal protein S4